MNWIEYDLPDCYAIAIYNLRTTEPNQMNLKIGDFLKICETNPGWYYGYNVSQPCVKRAFPQSFVRKLSHNINPKLWSELFSIIPNIRNAYMNLEFTEFNQIVESVEDVLLENSLEYLSESAKMVESNKRILQQKLDNCQRALGLPIEYQNDKDDKLNLGDLSVLSIFSQHQAIHESTRNVSSQFESKIGNLSLYIKLISVNIEKSNFTPEHVEIIITLYKSENNKLSRVSESYTYHVNFNNAQCDLYKANSIIIRDVQLSNTHKYFVAFQFVRLGSMNPKPKKDTKNTYRRPKGVAVMDVTDALLNPKFDEIEKQLGIQMALREESIELMTEQLMKDSRVNRAGFKSYFNVLLKMVKPEDMTEREVVLQGLNPNFPNPLKLRRSCLYVTLHHSEIYCAHKAADPNIEVEISLRDHKGQTIHSKMDDWRIFKDHKSVVYYHNAKPHFSEVLCVPLFDDVESFPPHVHFRFVVWHRSVTPRNGEKPVGVSYLKLFPMEKTWALLNNKENDNYHCLQVIKMDMDKINSAQYLKIPNEAVTLMDSNTSMRRKPVNPKNDILYVQSLVYSNNFTTDFLLANLCSGKVIQPHVVRDLESARIVTKIIDANELKKFSIKILKASLSLIETSNPNTFLSCNLVSLMAEMFKVIKNLPEYHDQVNSFINTDMVNSVHLQIMDVLISEQKDRLIWQSAEWFMKIVVKSFNLYQSSPNRNSEQDVMFTNKMQTYLEHLQHLSSRENEDSLVRGLVLRKAGLIIKTLVGTSKLVFLATLVDHLLKNSEDVDEVMTSHLTMEVIRSPLFNDPKCRPIIIPRTTNNIVHIFRNQIKRNFTSRDDDHDHLLDNVCDDMINFMSAHEQSWLQAANKDRAVKELLFDNNLLRQIIEIIDMSLDYLQKNDSNCKLLQKPIMVLVSVLLTCLKHISENLWKTIIKQSSDLCVICEKSRLTNSFDLFSELTSLIMNLQSNETFPAKIDFEDENSELDLSKSQILSPIMVSTRTNWRRKVRPWCDMLFVQSEHLLETLRQIYICFIGPHLLPNLQCIHLRGNLMPANMTTICNCHPSDEMQRQMIVDVANSLCTIITQHYLRLDNLPPTTVIRLKENAPKNSQGDLRLVGATTLMEFWSLLEILKLKFSNDFFRIFAKLTIIQNYKVRLLAAQGMLDIVHLNRETKKLELITRIDEAMEKANDENYYIQMSQAFKEAILPLRFKEDVELVDDLIRQMSNIEECSQHLSDASPLNGMIVIHNLRLFYHNIGRSDIIGRYLIKLTSIHSKMKNDTEMGYTLLELSSFYNWTEEVIQQNFLTPEYAHCLSQWELKSQLLENSLKFFEKEDWEKGIEVCKELIYGYEMIVVDFVKLRDVYKKMSEFTHRIMYDDRPEFNFFIVFYLGSGYPKFISDLPKRSVIIRSSKIARDFQVDLNGQFKNVKVERYFPTPEEIEGASELEKRICYMSLKPNDYRIPENYRDKNVKQRILRYYEYYQIKEFVYKKLMNPNEENASKKKIYAANVTISSRFPNILSVTPVVDINQTTIDVIYESISDLNSQLDKDTILFEDYLMTDENDKKKFYQKIKDCIIKYVSPVSGGVSKIVEMVKVDDSPLYISVINSVTRSLKLIYEFLQIFDICSNSNDYNTLLEEFEKLCDSSSSKLEYDFDEINTNMLREHFQKSRCPLTTRRPSIFAARRTEDLISTIARRHNHIPNDPSIEEFGESSRNSVVSEESFNMTPGPLSRPRLPSVDSTKQRISKQYDTTDGPPRPARNVIRKVSQSNIRE